MLHQSVWNPVLTSWPSNRSSKDHWNCAKSPHASHAPPSSPPPKKNTEQNGYRPVALMYVGMKVIWKTDAGPPEEHHWTLLDPLQFAYRANRSVDDAVTWESNSALRAHLHLSVDHELPDRQAAASEAGKIHIQNLCDQHWSSSGMFLPTALLPVHKRLHIQRPLCQAPEVCRWHHTDRPHSGR